MIFRSRFNREKTVPQSLGDGTQPVYEEFVADDGHLILKETGRDNLFAFVQESKDECDIYNIIDRYQRGDPNALNRRTGQYMDVVGLPTNLMEAHNTMLRVKSQFDALDPAIRQKFDNDVNVFVATVANSTPDALKSIFGVADANVDVKDGDDDVA